MNHKEYSFTDKQFHIMVPCSQVNGVVDADLYTVSSTLILTGGRTSHSMLGIPREIYENLVSPIKKKSLKRKLLRKTRLIIWDEVPMQHRFAPEAIDRTLRDNINQPDLPFGSITVVFRGDFQQMLPIIPKAPKSGLLEPAFKGLGYGGISRSFN